VPYSALLRSFLAMSSSHFGAGRRLTAETPHRSERCGRRRPVRFFPIYSEMIQQ
jgi:hypothetical protein